MKRIATALALCAFSAVSAGPALTSAGAEQEPVRINYPRVFGVRPGSPFLFRVPVSGSRPFTVTAEWLPGGLSLDPATGIVRGVIEDLEKKTHTVNFTARNATGSSRQTIRFVVGDRICLTPPMGWNSWYVWYHNLTEKHFRDAATAFERNGLAGHGWSYVSIDDCWQGERAGPDKGRTLQPNAKFPDIKGAVDHIHSLGFKAGIYTTPWVGSYAGFCGGTSDNAAGDIGGLPPDQCPVPGRIYAGNDSVHHVGSHWFMDADIRQMADWAFDLVKVDWTPNGVGAPLRHTNLIRDEQRSKFTIWCLNASPLILSSDPDQLDGFTLSMMSNDEVIAVDQDPLGKPAKEMPALGGLRLFVREMEDGSLVLGVINMGEACVEKIPWAKFGLSSEPRPVRDLWANHDLVAADHALGALPAHASLLLRTMSR